MPFGCLPNHNRAHVVLVPIVIARVKLFRISGRSEQDASPLHSPSVIREGEMQPDRIALIAGIASLGLAAAAGAPAPVQGPIAAHTSTPTPMGPIVDKKSASPGSKAANVFLLTGQ
jgi:hypothetical protein